MTYYPTCQNYIPNVCPLTCANVRGKCPSVEPQKGEVRVTSNSGLNLNPFTESGNTAGCYNPKDPTQYKWTYHAGGSSGTDSFYLASPKTDRQEYLVTICKSQPTIFFKVKAGFSYDFTTMMTYYPKCQYYVPNVCPLTCAHVSGSCPSVEPQKGQVRVTGNSGLNLNPYTESGNTLGCYNPKDPFEQYKWTYHAGGSSGTDTFYLASPGYDHQQYKVVIG
ncbi:unnamed protein product [Owenia fusiformis]|uniref:Uncharacterized protein n=1 Tax=Owenia fusiformis TaxID=6347 RepID=A0A8J1TG07_OWEFU|nr:unnamed protein product [Owenia fusiformis]